MWIWHFIPLSLNLKELWTLIGYFFYSLALTYYFGLTAAGCVYHPYMVYDSVGKCELPRGKISCSRVSTETDIPLLEPQQGHKTYRYSPGLHLWLSLLCGGWHSLASRHALARGSWHWGILAGEAWAPAWDRACLCTSWLWVLTQTWACSVTPLGIRCKSNIKSVKSFVSCSF